MAKDALTDKQWNALVERLAHRLWQKRHKGLIDPATTRAHAQKLMEAVQQGLGYGYADDLSPRQAQTLTELQRNVYHFSGAKNWHQLREMSALLTGEGKARSFNEFL
ncbi:hypothetical protein [Thermaurantimonas aggregans]|nr:hypothetical protein [Thermaurantimonas aggregans]